MYESIANVIIGATINVIAQAIVFPWFGYYVTLKTDLLIAAIFTVISIVRSFWLRRLFNHIHIRIIKSYGH